ncbi:MAG: carbamoyltransferase HypF [PVC group bacterium]|nr:carbamoyltransferase HypF [PVC group bacterium]
MTETNILRLRVSICGAVQGVGFRPFIYRLAHELNLAGWVLNSSGGVLIEVEGERKQLNKFLLRIEKDKPQNAFIQSLEPAFLDQVGYKKFEIRESIIGEKSVLILPDIATCPECIKEIFDPQNRRYLYPFTNCTHCGPRYSIIEALPYDRPNTTMKNFTMCQNCEAEYNNPQDRRFHAQPNACSECGPYLRLWDAQGQVTATRQQALEKTVQAIKAGQIVAVKGLGGFHLMVDALDQDAISRLRLRKHRESKPLALMYPSLVDIYNDCELTPLQERLLNSAEAPIVMVRRKEECSLPNNIAPHNPYLGVMVPYTPLHHLLLQQLGSPVVATSANLSNETICIDEQEALRCLAGIADIFLIHNRPITRHADDSIVRIFSGREIVMRRARGYAPLPITLTAPVKNTVLAVGGHLKNTIAIGRGRNVFVSPHIGDLDAARTFDTFVRTIDDFKDLYEFDFKNAVCDLHPAYRSTQFVKSLDFPVLQVQHHYAHILSCMAENELAAPVLGVSWDGTGYGPDKTVWGGEFLKINDKGFERFMHLREFHLPGGTSAVREPRRIAARILYELFGDELFDMHKLLCLQAFSEAELKNLRVVLEKKINSPVTSSMGRLFDAVSSLLGIRNIIQFEGQAAMELEFAIKDASTEDIFSIDIKDGIIDGHLVLKEILGDIEKSVNTKIIAAKFHNTLAQIIVEVAKEAKIEKVVLSGGCFQNKYLTEHAIDRLRKAGFKPYWHQRVPPNDGGISLGQIISAQRDG